MALDWYEIFLRLIPEVTLVNCGIVLLSNRKIKREDFLKCFLIASVCGYLVKRMPISHGIYMILNIICFICISITINKIDIVTSIKSTITIFLGMLVVETINILCLHAIFQEKTSTILEDKLNKYLLGIPSLLVYSVVIFMIYYYKKKRKRFIDDRKDK